MAEYAILSEATGQIISLLRDQTVYHVNLVRGAEKEVRSLADDLETLRNRLDDAENQRFKDKDVNLWLSRLEQTSHQMEDVLDEWRYAILKLQTKAAKQKVLSCIPSPSCLCFKKAAVHHRIAEKILNIKAQFDGILKDMDRFSFAISQPKDSNPLPESWRVQSTSSVDFSKVHGRESERDFVVGMLVDKQESSIQIVSVVGVGGLGKTTLAQLVYDHTQVVKTFNLRIWICVSDPFDLVAVAKGILESIEKGSSSGTDHLDILLKRVREHISGKRFLLVLDDVWTEDHNKWEPLENILKCGGHGSKVLVTTRNERVARMMGSREGDIYRPRILSDEDCWLILSRIALVGRNITVFEEIGKRIAKKCNGLPLATKTLGSLLLFRNSLQEWEDVLNNEIWELEKAKLDLFPHLLLSYNELSPTLKRCFSYCAVFPKDSRIRVKSLIEDWIALGYLGPNVGAVELKGRQMFNVIAARSLFQDFEKHDDDSEEIGSFQMHDIVHDFAQYVRRSGMLEATTCESCDPLLVSSVNEFCSLIYNIKADDPPVILCDCLLRLRVLTLDFVRFHRINIPQGIEKLIHLRLLRLRGIDKLSGEDLKHIFLLYNLQTLQLVDCDCKEIPKEIGNLINLTHLELSFISSLKGLPSEIGNLKELRHLDLSCNWSLEGLPSEIGNLKELRHLHLSGNSSLEGLPSEIGNLKELRHLHLSFNSSLKGLPSEIGNLKELKHLHLSRNVSLEGLPSEIGNLKELKHLHLSRNSSLEGLPSEIGNLKELRHLDLSSNSSLKGLPSEIGNLKELRHLDLQCNNSLRELPESICGLKKLRTLKIEGCEDLILPEKLAHLTGLECLDEIEGGSGRNKLGLLKELIHLSGCLKLYISLAGGTGEFEKVVEDALEAQLRNKMRLEKLLINFKDVMDETESGSCRWMELMEALEPHPKLQKLSIYQYEGLKFPQGWMVSPHNQLRKFELNGCNRLTSLPCLGMLPCLEQIEMRGMKGLHFVGREFLGITNRSCIAFPKLNKLTFAFFTDWKEWEDITEEEEESAAFSIMPCLKELNVNGCHALTELPHRLLRKASSLEILEIDDCSALDDSNANLESLNNPHLSISIY